MTDIWYATREKVASGLQITQKAYANPELDDAISASSRVAEEITHRRFYPETRVIEVDWPNHSFSPTWEIWLDDNEMVSITELKAGGDIIPLANVNLRRFDDKREPPYQRIEIDLSSASALHSGTTFQRAIQITGVFGFSVTDTSFTDGELGATIDANIKLITINPLVNSRTLGVGVGSLLLIENEYLVITERQMVDTGINTAGAITDSKSVTVVPVTDGSRFAFKELILIDGEFMQVDNVAGNNLIVSRAFDGSVLASHGSGTDVFAGRSFTVARGALGSTAIGHNINTAVTAHRYPKLVTELVIAEAITFLEQKAAAYARTVGAGNNLRETSGAGLEAIRARLNAAYGRTHVRLTAI